MRNIFATFAIFILTAFAGLAQNANPPYKLKKNTPDPAKAEAEAVPAEVADESAAEAPAPAGENQQDPAGEEIVPANPADESSEFPPEEELEITLLPPAEEGGREKPQASENAGSESENPPEEAPANGAAEEGVPDITADEENTPEENAESASENAEQAPDAAEEDTDTDEADEDDEDAEEEDDSDEIFEDAKGAITPGGKKAEDGKPKVEISDEERLTNVEKSGIVAIMGTNGSATGFLATIQDKVFLVTNVHVIAGMDKPTVITMSGDEIKLGPVFTGRGHDIAISPIASVPENCKPLTFCESPALSVHNNDKIVVCGNSEGRGTMLETYGTVIALGPKLVELNCPFYEGNSGSPVFHIPTRTVIGVTSHATIQDLERSSPLSKASRSSDQSAIKSDTRYFGYRFDSVKNWERVNLNMLRKQNDVFDGYKHKLQIIHQHFGSDGKLTLDITLYKEFADIIGAYKKELSNLSNPAARRRAEKNMYDKLTRMCINEASRLKGLKTISAYDDMRETYQQEFERLALIFKNAHENKIF